MLYVRRHYEPTFYYALDDYLAGAVRFCGFRPPAISLGRMILLLLMAIPASSYPQDATWKPNRYIEFITSAGAGGAQDVTVRLIDKIWRDKHVTDVPTIIVNKAGGGGVIGWTYLHQHAGDGHYLSMITVTLLTTHLIGQSPLNYTDFTPVAMLFNEYVVFAVKADSQIKTGRDLIDLLKKDPGSVRFALSSALGNANHIAVGKVMKETGGDVRKLKIVVFRSNSEVMAATLGGHVDVGLVPASIAVPYMNTGMRVIGIAAPQRLEMALAAVPTWREQGVNAVSANWRGIMGPPGMTPAQVAYWERACDKLAQADEWKEDLKRNVWIGNYMGSQKSATFIAAQYQELKSILAELGVTK
jgi:putative tricarboxylic transport membrane protein